VQLSNDQNSFESKSKKLLDNWVWAFFIYLILVWGFAVIRSNYLWITGDDPNLLVQSILTREGKEPNFDFESGYPGLSQFTQSFLMQVFGVNIFSQHLYTALLSTVTGLLICLNFRKVPVWILATSLILIYCQEHLVNPTPNPGHLFILILIALYTLINVLPIKNNLIKTCLISLFFGISFLSKQYAIIFFVGFVLTEISFLKEPKFAKYKYKLILLMGLAVALLYYIVLIPYGTLKILALFNLTLSFLPFAFFLYLNKQNKTDERSIELKELLNTIVISSIVFISTAVTGLVLLYRDWDVNNLLKVILFDMPKKINSNLVLFQFDYESIVSMISFTFFMIVILILNFYSQNYSSYKIFYFPITLVLILSAVFVFSKIGNLSANLVMVVLPILIIVLFFKHLRSVLPKYKLYLFSLTCYQFVLIPYPNINFHIAAYVIGLLILVSKLSSFNQNKFVLTTLLLPVLLSSSLLYKEHKDISQSETYFYGSLKFKSADDGWINEIENANIANKDISECETAGCKLLILLSNRE
jgi:hypothetical protein